MSDELKSTMSEEDVKKLLNFVAENQDKDPINDVVEEGEERLVNVLIDTATGKPILTNVEATVTEPVDFNSILDDSDFKIEEDNSPITLEELTEYLTNNKDNSEIEQQLADTDLSADDLKVLIVLVQKYQRKEKISSPYNKMPESCKKIINKSLNIGSNVVYSNEINTARNAVAEMFLDQFVSSITVNRMQSSMNGAIEKVFSQATSEIGDTIVGYTEERNQKYREYIENNIDDSEKKEKALKILDSLDHSYELKEFKEYCKICKIRKIDVEKPTKDHNHLMDNIMSKYENEQNYNIYNIYNCQTVLSRHINKDVADCEMYTDTQIRAFFIAFSMYCKNFSPKNVYEHIFMFYTLYNILLMDVNTGEKAEVSQLYLTNIKECIDNLIARNNFLD